MGVRVQNELEGRQVVPANLGVDIRAWSACLQQRLHHSGLTHNESSARKHQERDSSYPEGPRHPVYSVPSSIGSCGYIHYPRGSSPTSSIASLLQIGWEQREEAKERCQLVCLLLQSASRKPHFLKRDSRKQLPPAPQGPRWRRLAKTAAREAGKCSFR